MRRIISLLLATGFLCVWGLVTLFAQQNAAPPASGKDGDIPVSRLRRTSSSLTVYVHGKDGKPVASLKPEDFYRPRKRQATGHLGLRVQSLSDEANTGPGS